MGGGKYKNLSFVMRNNIYLRKKKSNLLFCFHLFHRQKRHTQRAHFAGKSRTNHFSADILRKCPQNRVVFESSALNDNMLAQNRTVRNPHDFCEKIFHNASAKPRQNIADGFSAFLLGNY